MGLRSILGSEMRLVTFIASTALIACRTAGSPPPAPMEEGADDAGAVAAGSPQTAGPSAATGESAPTGVSGPTGEPGPTAATGTTGTTGTTSATGPTGVATRAYVDYSWLAFTVDTWSAATGGGFRRWCGLSVPIMGADEQVAYHTVERVLERLTTDTEGISLRVHTRTLGAPLDATPHQLFTSAATTDYAEKICSPYFAGNQVVFRADFSGNRSALYSHLAGSDGQAAMFLPMNTTPDGVGFGTHFRTDRLLAADVADPIGRALLLGTFEGGSTTSGSDRGIVIATPTASSVLLREGAFPSGPGENASLDEAQGVLTMDGAAWLWPMQYYPNPLFIWDGNTVARQDVTSPGVLGFPQTTPWNRAIRDFSAISVDEFIYTYAYEGDQDGCAESAYFWFEGTYYKFQINPTPWQDETSGVLLESGERVHFTCTPAVQPRAPEQHCYSRTEALTACNQCPCGPGPRPPGRIYPTGAVMNEHRVRALPARLDGTLSLLRWRPTGVQRVISAGVQVPSEPPGTFVQTLSPNPAELHATAPSMNARDQIAFYATLSGPAVTAGENDLALFITDPVTEEPRLVLRTGDLVPWSDRLLKIRDFEFQNGSGGADGLRSGLSPEGRLAVLARVQYFDGSAEGITQAILVVQLR